MIPPSILIVNDDSIFSEGIKALWEAMSEIGNTTVVAPKFDNSGAGHAITISRPLQYKILDRANNNSGNNKTIHITEYNRLFTIHQSILIVFKYYSAMRDA